MAGALIAVVMLAAGATPRAEAAPQYAAYVMDARTGEALYEKNADTRVPPASLTKMMTLYLVFEAIESGKLDLDQRVTVSAAAARQPAVKIGFRQGQRVVLRDVIRSAAVRSANDSAVILAEAVAGSEAAFAKLMTRRAHDFGMTNTTFRNASGLPSVGHLSTAHEMAMLGRRLFYDFPQYYNLFGRESTRAFGKTIWNTNKLLSSYRGADGIKTGYTRAAGYNLVASAERGSERIIAAMLGGSSSSARNAEVARLLDLGFARAPSKVREIPPATVVAVNAPAPEPRPNGDDSPGLLAASVRELGEALAPSAAQASVIDDYVVPLVDPTRQAPLRAHVPPPRRGVTDGDWGLKLGSYATPEVAVARLASTAFGDMPALARAGREIDVTGLGGSTLYRARLTGLSSATAKEACRRLSREGKTCEMVPPSN